VEFTSKTFHLPQLRTGEHSTKQKTGVARV
jgi:hypothetical protein